MEANNHLFRFLETKKNPESSLEFSRMARSIRMLILAGVLGGCAMPFQTRPPAQRTDPIPDPVTEERDPKALAFFNYSLETLSEVPPVVREAEVMPISSDIAPVKSDTPIHKVPSFAPQKPRSLPASFNREPLVTPVSTVEAFPHISPPQPELSELESFQYPFDPYHSLPGNEFDALAEKAPSEDVKLPNSAVIESHASKDPLDHRMKLNSFKDLKIEVRDSFAIYLYFGMMGTFSVAAASLIIHERLQARKIRKILEEVKTNTTAS